MSENKLDLAERYRRAGYPDFALMIDLAYAEGTAYDFQVEKWELAIERLEAALERHEHEKEN